jgi:hypothetical protein
MAKGCEYLREDCTMDGTDYDCEHPTYGEKYGCDYCPIFGRNRKRKKITLDLPWNYYQHGETGRICATTASLSGEWYPITKEQYTQYQRENK